MEYQTKVTPKNTSEPAKEKTVPNSQIQHTIKKSRVHQWEIAKELGISEFTLSRWLRTGLNLEQSQSITKAIDTILAREK